MNETIQTILIILLIFALYLVFDRFREKRRLKSLRQQRPGFSKMEYTQHFEEQGFKRTEIEAVYDSLKEFLAEDDFQLNPEDDFQEDYKIVDLDDVEMIHLICDRLQIPYPADEDYAHVNQKYSTFNALSTLTLIEKIKERTTHSKK